ncbi:hypothetical protein EK21DRAFT_104909 [Setomelanomma holmii]|uniref:Uncharacterized protein n=1 Tax=Setomelanomma holmii TaxID=210430 RepID=A0A9P4LHF2_9PLEO|nr:hypothetical protein EK21DRAFT_104909 [Setomelanomma holmii]
MSSYYKITDPKVRRKRQNRINQRARPNESPQTGDHLFLLADVRDLMQLHILGPDAPSSLHIISQLESAAKAAYAAGSPRTDLILSLNQLNILQALTANIEVLGFTASDMHDDALSSFSSAGTFNSSYTTTIPILPTALTPTLVQLTIPHHPWLDLIPLARLRDNLILADAAHLLDDAALCHDLCGQQSAIDGISGVIVWRYPWNPSGWEVTRTFLERWGLGVEGVLGVVEQY